MKKKIIITMVALMVVLSYTITAFASPQKPFEWKGNLNTNTLDFNENTAVEMKNGDGTDVKTVSGRYISDNSIKKANGTPLYPVMANAYGGFVLPSDVDSVSCQVVKEDAYLIMPFDGFVTIGICDDEIASDLAKICVRAKAGDKVNLVPRNLVNDYTTVDVDGNYSLDKKKTYENTTADDWTYNLRIYKEVLFPLAEDNHSPKANEDKYIGQAIDNENSFSCLWYLYQVDAPDTTLRAKEVSVSDMDNYNKYDNITDINGNVFTGWLENPEVTGCWKYVKNGTTVKIGAGYPNEENPFDLNYAFAFVSVPKGYKEYMTVSNGDIFIEGYKINSKNSMWMDPAYNIVNAQ